MAEPEVIGALPPPVRRDGMVQAWVAVSILSWTGNSAWAVALAWTAVERLSPAQAGIVLSISAIPQALFVVLGGVIADRWDTRKVLSASQLGHMAILLVGVLLWGKVDIFWLLIGLGCGFGCVTGLTSPASAVLGRQLVATKDLATVSSWNQVGARMAGLLGAPIGAVLVGWGGLVLVMIVDSATFLAALLAIVVIVRPRFRLRPDVVAEHWVRSLRGGFAYLGRDKRALVFVVALCGLNVFSGPVISLGLPLRIKGVQWRPEFLGLAQAVFSAAAIVGSLIGGLLRVRRPATLAFSLLILQGVSYAGIGVPHQVVVAGSMAVIGLTAGMASVWLSALFVTVIDGEYLGRVASLSNLGDLALVPLMTPAFGALAAVVGVTVSLIVPALLMVVMCSIVVARRDIRELGLSGRIR